MMERIKLPYMDPARVADEIGAFVLDKALSTYSTGCVIGLSGGVDSSVTAALIKRAFDRQAILAPRTYLPEREQPILELVGYMLPSRINNPADQKDAVDVAEKLGIRYQIVNLENVVQAYKETNPEAFNIDYDKGNMISRIRATVLNTKAATENKILAGTGNKDEDFGIGYYTLFGDGAVHMSPIAGLSKRLVREMAAYLELPEMIANREPTAGIEVGQTDFKDLGYGYDVVELVTEGITQGFNHKKLVKHEQIVPLANEQMKIYKERFRKKRFTDVGQVVDDVLRRHEIAKMKYQIISPPAPQVTLEYR